MNAGNRTQRHEAGLHAEHPVRVCEHQFESERIVILGGTSGIGLATAERAAADGATVIVASSSAERIDAALERLPASAEGYTVDVRREEQIRDLFSRLGSFDHLAFTAGETLQIGAIADTDLEAARRALDVRLWGAYAAVKHAVPHLAPGRVDRPELRHRRNPPRAELDGRGGYLRRAGRAHPRPGGRARTDSRQRRSARRGAQRSVASR